ncbi:MAG: hypothetical protein IAE83_01225 [Anaerolinea sp.]|nr:hypothetical protein [Anaerolinea sp.]MCC6974578.1 hypothetical protein [Anaerolineae bacterium]CAG0982615.1 Transcription antitermination protein RfaH [Anaerolineae bacterium]
MPAWYTLRSKPHKEIQVHDQLVNKGIETYYPFFRVKPVNPRSATIRPFFPGYLFVHIDLDETGSSPLLWLPGAIGLVQFGDYAPPLPDHFIANLRSRIAQIESAGGLKQSALQKGDPVRITGGSLQGYEAVFDSHLSGDERVQVLLNILGRLVSAQVDITKIEKINRR